MAIRSLIPFPARDGEPMKLCTSTQDALVRGEVRIFSKVPALKQTLSFLHPITKKVGFPKFGL
jgi:hypothetical protein